MLAAAVCLLLVGGGLNVALSEPAHVKVTICHRTNSVSNPYNKITVNLRAVDGDGHSDHQGHNEGGIFDPTFDYPPNQKDWGDIIPPFDENGDPIIDPSFPGPLNWTPLGQAVFENGDCEVTGEPELNAALTIDKQATPPQVGIEENVVFSIVVTSTGNATAEDVTLNDTLPSIPSVSWLITGGDGMGFCQDPIVGNVLSCSYGDMAPASSFTVVVSTEATSPDSCGAFTNLATAEASNTAAVSDDAVAEVDCSGSTS